jgi:hypothetical protein
MRIFLIIIAAALALGSCNKDKFTTKPQLKLKSINADTVFANTGFEMDIEFTDQEGDIDSIFIRKTVTNKSLPPLTDKRRLPESVPAKTTLGNFLIAYFHGNHPTLPPIGDPLGIGDDLVIFKIVVKDAAGNASDTLEIPQIKVKKR